MIPYNVCVFTLTLSTKGQLTLPKAVREALRLEPGSKVRGNVDENGRLVLVPDLYEPEQLFEGRPIVKRRLSVTQMNAAISRGVGRGHV
jgi:antitoxin PrlF